MPTVLEINGFKFKFFSNENDEPIHVHIIKGGGNAKIWLDPVIVEEYSYNFTVQQRREIRRLVRENAEILKRAWDDYFA